MFVKEITIDGFKSYAQRQVVAGFDPQFNAITGLNGSGKSNILDSICFVLGIQNLQQVGARRAPARGCWRTGADARCWRWGRLRGGAAAGGRVLQPPAPPPPHIHTQLCTRHPDAPCPAPRTPAQVRANSLQELVYKQGQAGVTKATVSIVFDNTEKERGPVRRRWWLAGRWRRLRAAARAAAGVCGRRPRRGCS